MTTTRFCLVRHGETDWNVERRLQGHTDIELNAQGLAQAEQMAQALKNMDLQFDVLYTSDLQRARQTANAIERLFHVSAIASESLRERHLGALQGLSYHEAPIAQPELWQIHLGRDLHHDMNGGESILQFSERIQNALARLHKQYTGKTILLVSHGGAIDMMYRMASKQTLASDKAVTVPNASLNWISHDGIDWKVDRWGDTRHLQENSLDNLDL